MLTHQEQRRLAGLADRHGRKKTPSFLMEGWRCCHEALTRCPDWIEDIYCAESCRQRDWWPLCSQLTDGQSIRWLTDGEFSRLSETEHPQGICCVLRRPNWPRPTALPQPFCLILDGVSEPGNVGTILRTAWAVGLTSVWWIKGGGDPYAPKVVRAGMGAQFALSLPTLDSLADAKDHFKSLGGNQFWLTLPQADISLFDEQKFSFEKSALVIGNEANGVSDTSLGEGVTIPMPGHAESLNAAQAATVFLCEAVRRKLFKEG